MWKHAPCVIREMQINIIRRFKPTSTAMSETPDITKCWQGCGVVRAPCHSRLARMQTGRFTLEDNWPCLQSEPKGTETFSTQNLTHHVHSSVSSNYLTWGGTRMSFSKWPDQGLNVQSTQEGARHDQNLNEKPYMNTTKQRTLIRKSTNDI